MPNISLITVTFTYCSNGWIYFVIAATNSQITLHATFLYDPFPDMLKWLEEIISRQKISTWHIDEESTSVDLLFTIADDRQGVLIATDICDITRKFKVSITPSILVRTFYQSLRNFASSTSYHPDDWQTCSCLPADHVDQYGTDLRTLRSQVIEEWLDQQCI